MKNIRKIRNGGRLGVKGNAKGVIYVRVSSTEQVAGTSLDEQERESIKYCADKGIEVVQVFREEGASAKTAERRVLLEAVDYCKKSRGKIDAFIVWKVDRLARNATDHFAVRTKLKEYGVRLHSVTETIGDSPTEKLAETVYAGFAEFDNSIRRVRAINGMRARIKEGIWPFKAPVGYRNMQLRQQGIKKTQPDPPDPLVFPVLQRVMKGFAKEVYTQKEIVNELIKADFQKLSGTKPSLQFVDRLLSEENLYFYAGILRDAFDDEYQFYPGRHQPMITEEEMNRINLIRKKGPQVRIARDRYNPNFPLRRVVLCAACNHALTGSSSRGRKGYYAYYHCHNKACAMRGKSIPKSEIESQFQEVMKKVKPTPRFMGVLTEAVVEYWQEQTNAHVSSQKAHEEALRALKVKKDKVYEMAEGGAYTASDVRERLESINLSVMEEELALAGISAEHLDPRRVSDKASESLSQLMANSLELDPAIRYRFQKVVFPEGISYEKTLGFGTAKVGRIFELNRSFSSANSLKVRRVGFEPT